MRENWQDRFWEKVSTKDKSLCWDWVGAISSNGYGSFSLKGKKLSAHRVAYELHYGFIDERFVCHSCDNQRCCNPSHLFLGSHADNMQDMKQKGRNFLSGRKGYQAAKQTGKFTNTTEFSAKGSKNGQAKLNEESVVEIKRMLALKCTHLEIAKKFGVSKTLITHISQKKIWKHI